MVVELHFQALLAPEPIEEQPSAVILHGLFGSHRNWRTIAKKLNEKRWTAYLLDLRNHGQSGWSDVMNYSVMAEDVIRFIENNIQQPVHLVGHSMGGKTGMVAASQQPDLFQSLTVVDILPIHYPDHLPDNQQHINTMLSVDTSQIHKRLDAIQQLKQVVDDDGLIALFLQNLVHNPTSNRYQWQLNLRALYDNMHIIVDFPQSIPRCNVPTLQINGEQSDFVPNLLPMQPLFLNLQSQTIANAGHLPHAQFPDITVQHMVEHFSRNQFSRSV